MEKDKVTLSRKCFLLRVEIFLMILSLNLAASSRSSGQWQGGDRPQTGGSLGSGSLPCPPFLGTSLSGCLFSLGEVLALISFRSWATRRSIAVIAGGGRESGSGIEVNVVGIFLLRGMFWGWVLVILLAHSCFWLTGWSLEEDVWKWRGLSEISRSCSFVRRFFGRTLA